MRFLIYLILFILSLSFAYGQQVHSMAWYNKTTYQSYLLADWEGLVKLGNAAIKDGYDFYFLRMRLGMAFYYQGKYRKAITHFSRALTFNFNPLVLEYLYYSYKFSGQGINAAQLYAANREVFVAIGIASPTGFITGVYSEAGLKLLGSASSNIDPLVYAHVGVMQQLGGRLNLYQGYTRVSRNYVTASAVSHVQNEYYLKASLLIERGFQWFGSLHTQSIRGESSYSNVALLTGFNLQSAWVDAGLAYGWASINQMNQHQGTASLTLYPLLNQNLYLQSVFTYQVDNSVANNIFYQKAGVKVTKILWLEGYGSIGDMRNIQDMDGFYLYNTVDKLTSRIGITTHWLLGAKSKLLAGYTYENYLTLNESFSYFQHYVFLGFQYVLKK